MSDVYVADCKVLYMCRLFDRVSMVMKSMTSMNVLVDFFHRSADVCSILTLS